MALYDFLCNECNEQFEVSCKISDLKTKEHLCPSCGSTNVSQHIFSAPKRAESHRLGVNQRQREFKDVLNRIHKTTPGSTLDKTTNL